VNNPLVVKNQGEIPSFTQKRDPKTSLVLGSLALSPFCAPLHDHEDANDQYGG
jgi:hypothetical protein